MESGVTVASVQTGWPAMEELAAGSLPPKEFWSRFAAGLREITGAAIVLGMHRAGDQPWRVIASAVDAAPARKLGGEEFVRSAPGLAEAACSGEPFPRPFGSTGALAAAAPVTSRRNGEQAAVLALAAGTMSAAALDAQVRAAVLIPSTYEARLAIERAESGSRSVTGVLDLIAVVNAEERFGAAALAFCNALASHFRCERVSLGWLSGGYSRLAAVSRHEQVNRKMEAAQRIEAAMDECLDQDEAISFPPPAEASFIAHDHRKLASAGGGSPHLFTAPLHQSGAPVAAVLCERDSTAFSAVEIAGIRLACEQAAPRLAVLRAHDRWFGARFAAWLRERAAGLLGPRRTLTKLAALLTAVLLAVLVFWKTEYRVEGNFVLRSGQVSNLTSPMEGYIKEVLVESGDEVQAGQVLLRLNTDALHVEETAAVAELERYTREEEKARAANAVAEMQIAATMARQAAAKLDIVRFRLAQAEIKSSMDGVILEGDLKEHLDAPVKLGDPLFRIAQLGDYTLEIELDERDAHEVSDGASGECAFLSRPEESLPIKVDLVLPSAVEKEGVNLFAARARIESPRADWWRPGLSGVAKINAGERSLLWIVSHRTVDFLRLKLWW